jgi:hypothetical protein
MARPISITPDERTIWDLAFLGASNREIAEAVGCHQSLLSKRTDLIRVMEQARTEAAAALTQLWSQSSAGALRGPTRASELVDMVRGARRRSLQRQGPSLEYARTLTLLTASSGESSGSDG